MRQRFQGRDGILAKALIVTISAAACIYVEQCQRETLSQDEIGDLASCNAQAKIAAHVANEIETDWLSHDAHLPGRGIVRAHRFQHRFDRR